MAGISDSIDYVPSWARTAAPAAPLGGSAVPLEPVGDYSGGDSQIARGIRTAFTGAKSALQGFGAMGAEMVGADEYARQLYDYAQANQRLAEEQAPRVRTIRQVMESENPLSAGVDYLAGTIGQTTPYLLFGGAGALAGRGLGAVSGLRAGLSGDALAARMASGAGYGGTAAIHPVMAGDQAVQMRNDPAAKDMGVGERALRANVVGGMQAAANALAPAAMVNQTFARGVSPGILPRIAGNMALEGVGEGAEEVINQAHRTTYDPSFQMDPEAIGENAAAGFFGAAPVAGVHGVASHGIQNGTNAVVDGAKALGAGAAWLGEEAYSRLPQPLQGVADHVAAVGKATKEEWDALAPHLSNALDAAKTVAGGFIDDTAENIKQYREDALADAAPSAEDVITDLLENTLVASEQTKMEAGKIADDIRDDPAIGKGIKSFLSSAKGKTDELLKTAEAFSDLSKWVGENEDMTVEKLQAINAARQQPQRLRRYAEEITDFLDEVGQDTPVAQELRGYAERMAKGENLTPDEVQNFWLKSRLAAEIERTSENLDALWKAKGVKMAEKNGKVETENLSRQKDVVNKAVREALANAKTDPDLAKGIARRIQTKDVLELGADRAVRHAVGDELAARGIDPKANNTFTDMYNRVLAAVNEQVESLREEGVLPDGMVDDLPDAYRNDIREAFTEMLQATPTGQEMAKSEKLFNQHLDGLTDYVLKLANGDLGEHAAVKLRQQLEKAYGEAGTQAVDRIIGATAQLYGGLGDAKAERVHGMVNLNKTLHQQGAEIRNLLKNKEQDLNELLDDIATARDFDTRRAELPKAVRELAKLSKSLPFGSDRRYQLEGVLTRAKRDGLLDEGVTGFKALKQKWVGQNIVSARKFDQLVSALESYERNPDKLDRAEKTVVSKSSAANYAAEDENDFEAQQEQAENVDGEPITNFDLDGKRTGDERQEYIEKRQQEKYGQTIHATDRAAPIYWGANAFEGGGHDATKVTAPVTRHKSGDYENGSEYSAATEQAHAKYGHRVTKAHAVSVQRWAAEMAADTGKSERQLMNEAMKALLEHDEKRRTNPRLTDEDRQWITARANLAGRIGTSGDAGERFFQNKMNRNYRYYRMEQGDASNLSYSVDWLKAVAGLRSRDGVSEDVGAFVERMQEKDGHKFNDEVYKKSLLPVKTTDGETIQVDVAKLVADALAHHQAADVTGLGEKKQETNLSEQLVTAFHNVMAALMTADGVAEVGGTVVGEDAAYSGERAKKGKVKGGKNEVWNSHINPDIVILRDPTGRVVQQGEHVLQHSVKRAYTLGELTKIAGVDMETLKTQFKDRGTSPGVFSDEDMSTIFRAEKRGRERASDVSEKAKVGVAYRAAEMNGKPVSIDFHHMLSRMLERNGMDPHTALQQEILPTKLAAMMLREGMAEAKARGMTGELAEGMFTDKYDGVVVYHQNYGDEPVAVTLGKLKKLIANPDAVAPRNLRDAKIQDAVERLQRANKEERDIVDREQRGAAKVADKIPENRAKLGARIDNEVSKTAFLYGQPENQERSGAPMQNKVVDDNVVRERGKGDTPRFSQDEGENMRIQQILKELGEDAQGDTPLFDKIEAFGTSGGKERPNQQRPTEKQDFEEDFEGPRQPQAPSPDYVKELYSALQEASKNNPEAARFLEDTFGMSFEGKDFGEYMAKRAEKRNALARKRNDLGSVERPLPEKTQPLTLAEQRTNAKMTVETLATNEQGLVTSALQKRREAAVNEAKGKMAETLEQEKAEAKARLDEQEKKALANEAAKEVKETLPAPAARLAEPASTMLEAVRFVSQLSPWDLKGVLQELRKTAPQDGTLGQQVVKRMSDTSDSMADWVSNKLKSAGMESFSAMPNAPFSRQRTVSEAPAGAKSVEALQAEVDRLLGEGKVKLEMPGILTDANGAEISGKYDDKLKKILVSALAADRMDTTRHETWHRIEELLGEMGENGKRVLDEMYKYASSLPVQRWLHEQFADDDGVLSQLDSPKERAAYVFQQAMRDQKAPGMEKTGFQKFKDWIRRMLGKMGFETTTNTERAETFLDYVKNGGFARDVENSDSVRKGLGEKNGDNLVRLAADTIKPVMEGLEKVLGHTSERVRKLGVSEYNQIVDMFGGEGGKGGWQLDKHRHINKFSNLAGDILGGKSNAEQQKILNDGGLNTMLGTITEYMKAAGVDGRTRSRLYDQLDAFNQEKVNDDFEEFVTDLIKHGGFKGKAGEARKIASDIANRGYFYDPDLKLFEGREDIAEKWTERAVIDKTLRFIDRAAHIAETTRHFGQKKEYVSPTGQKYWQEEKLHDLLEAGDEKSSPEGRQLVRDYIEAMNGNYGERLSPTMKKLVGGMLFAQNVHILPMMVFSQMLEPMQLALRRNALRGSLDSLFRGIRDMPRTFDAVNKRVAPDEWEKLAYQVGTAPTRIINGVMSDLMNGVSLTGKVGEWNNRFFRYNFMEQWNRSMHVEATKHAVEFLKENKRLAESKSGATDKDGTLRSERFLKELGLKASDIKIAKDGSLELNDATERAIVQFVEEAMAHPDAGSNALWMNDPRFALISQMKRFTFANAKYILDRGMKEMKLGNAFPVAPAMLAMPWMMAADGLRDAVSGTPGYEAKSALDYAMHGVERANLVGRGQFGLDMVEAAGRGGSPVEAVAGPTAEMFGNVIRGANNGHLIDAMLDYTPGGAVLKGA